MKTAVAISCDTVWAQQFAFSRAFKKTCNKWVLVFTDDIADIFVLHL